MAQIPKKTVPFMKTIRVALDASGIGTGTITADNNRKIVIEQFTQDTRVTATKALTDNEVVVDVKDKINSSYTKGEVPITALAGKASSGFPKHLPQRITIEKSTALNFEFRDLSAVANTIALTAIGYEEVLG